MDTQNKRASALGRSLRSFIYFPSPDGALSSSDRIHISGLYAGIASIIVTLSQFRTFHIDQDNRVFSIDEDSRVLIVGGG